MASCDIRMDSSSGKSTRSLLAICSGLHEAAHRRVPMHSWLCGHLLQGAVTPAAGRMFPELTRCARKGTLANTPSRWFNGTWLRKHCAIEDRKKVLYSLRHTVATTLKGLGHQQYLIEALLGHSDSSMSTGRYGKDVPVKKLAELVESLPFGDQIWNPQSPGATPSVRPV